MLRPTRHYIIIAVTILAVVLIYDRFVAVHTPPTPEHLGTDNQAQAACQEAVRGKLKAPATAQFGAVIPLWLDGGRYQVNGSVDAQNGFGALLRMTYDCTVVFTGGDNYHIEHIAVTEP